MTSAAINAPKQQTSTRRPIQTRYLLLGVGAAMIVLALLAILQAWNTYSTTLDLYRSIVESSAAKVNAAEQALQFIAAVDTHTADFVATAPDDPKHWTSLDAVHASYQNFRDQMFAVRQNLSDGQETTIFNRMEYLAFDQFWQHIGNALTAEQNGNSATAVKEYIVADNYLQNPIATSLLQLEALNFAAMVNTTQGAVGTIRFQAFIMSVLIIALAIGLTVMSFWLRSKIRRYLTPGIDIAMVLGWILALTMVIQLSQTPGQLDEMVNRAYYSISAASRVLAVANQGNSMQSGSVIDPTNAIYWEQDFDRFKAQVELRICGAPGCLSRSFLQPGTTDQISNALLTVTGNISAADRAAIGGISPLVANVNYPGEAAALEAARIAFNDYVAINQQVRTLIANKQMDEAAALSTGEQAKQSAEAFNRFSTQIDTARSLNRQVFDDIWHTADYWLTTNRVTLALAGFVLVILGVLLGVYHRYREL